MDGATSGILLHIQTWLVGGWAAACAGRLAWHARLVQKGERRFISRALFSEIPMVAFGYIVGAAICSYLGWKGQLMSGVIAVAAYLGPGGISAIAQWYLRKDSEK